MINPLFDPSPNRVFPVSYLYPRRWLTESRFRIVYHAFSPFDTDVPYFEFFDRIDDEYYETYSVVLFHVLFLISWKKSSQSTGLSTTHR